MKFFKSLIEEKAAPVETTIVEAREETHEIDGEAMRVGDFLIWASALTLKHDVIVEVIVRVHNTATKTTYFVEFHPKGELNIADEVAPAVQNADIFVTLANQSQGHDVDEETEQFVTKLVQNYLTKNLDDIAGEVLNPQPNPDFEETYASRREKMRQAADARAELDLDRDF